MDQLVMPKLLKAVSDWSLADGVPLHNIVLPWLQHVGLRMEFLLDDARRKLRSMMRSWKVLEGVPDGLLVWKDVRFSNCSMCRWLISLLCEFSVGYQTQRMG
jgi:tuftelin-interacting protein 11